MARIPREEIIFHPHSFADPDGRLFRWRGELYRGITHARADFFKRLFDNGVIEKLAAQHLIIESEPTALALDGYALVIRHRSVPFVSYPQEWCPAMFKDAARGYLDLVAQLIPQGLTLRDTHPWNLLFDGCKPVYVDITSIRAIPDSGQWIAADKYRHYYLYPLLLMAHGHERIARHLLPDYEGISSAELFLLTGHAKATLRMSLKERLKRAIPPSYREPVKRGLHRLELFNSRQDSQGSRLDCLETLRNELEGIGLPDANEDSTAPDDSILPLRSESGSPPEPLERIIADLQPKSVLTIDGRSRISSRLASLAQRNLIALAKSSTRITRVYHEGRDKNLPILPLVMDFIDPTPSRGLQSHLCIAAAERLQCDMVLVFRVMDCLMERSLRSDQIVDGLAQFTKRFLLIELKPPKNNTRNLQVSSDESESFMDALSKKFRKISRYSVSDMGGAFLVCEK